jgi:hypothetical protein
MSAPIAHLPNFMRSPITQRPLVRYSLHNALSFDTDSARLPSMDADIAAYLRALAERVRRNVPLRHDPEYFHVEKACICQDLEHLARDFEPCSLPGPTIMVQRRRSVRRTVERHRST